MINEIEQGTNKLNNIPGLWIGRIHIIKMSIIFEVNYRLKEISIKISMVFFFIDIEKSTKIHLESQKTLNDQSNYEQEQAERTSLPDFKVYNKAQ